MFNRDTEALFIALAALFVISVLLASAGWAGYSRYRDCYAQANVIAEDSIDLTEQLAVEVMDRLDSILTGRSASNEGVNRIGRELADNNDALEDLAESCE